MRKITKTLITAVAVAQFGLITAFAGDANVTSYAFADIAGNISGDTITVNVPYSTKTTYWDHRVQVSEGATFTAGAIQRVDDMHSVGILTVTSDDGQQKTYTVKLNKNKFQGPTYELGKAKSIKKDRATIPVQIQYNDAQVSNAKIYYYTKKNSQSQKTIQGQGEQEVEITGLKEDTKYYYYLSIDAKDKTYETSAKSFTTKKKTDSGTSSSGGSSNKSSINKNSSTSKGTGDKGPGTDAKQDNKKVNQWSLEDGKWYYYGADGYSKTGWFQVGGKWYYTTKGTNELAMGGWKKIDNSWYFFDAAGAMLANQWIWSDAWYYVGASGAMVVNQELNINGARYIINPNGKCLINEWFMRDGRWMFTKENGAIAINENFQYDGVTYHADENGYV